MIKARNQFIVNKSKHKPKHVTNLRVPMSGRYTRPQDQLSDEENPFVDSSYVDNPYDFTEDGDLANHQPSEDIEGHELADMPHIVPYSHQHTNSQVPFPSFDDNSEMEGFRDVEKDGYGDEEEDQWDERRFTSRPVSQFLRNVPGGSDENLNEHALHAPSPEYLQENEESGWARRQNLSRVKRAGTRKVDLVQGEVFRSEYPVPTAVRMSVLPEHVDPELGSTEFSHMRYTAATCDPDEFKPSRGYSLRALEYERETELLVCITYYNEDKVLTARTMHGVMQNIRDICRLKKSQFWGGKDAWKKIQVVLVMDGLDPCDKNVLDVLATMGLYQDGVMKREVNGEPTVAHIFEYTTQLCVLPDQKLVRPEEGNPNSLPPIQLTLCLKQENTKKINSHRWVFNAFCPILRPEVVILVDAGTRPGPRSFFYLWQAFYNDKNVGGACGEIHAMLGPHKRALLNPLVASQNFEYKISNILDKPLESLFGYISVLPGAFSSYRYRAVEGRPLTQYFMGDHTLSKRLGSKGIDGMSIFKKNMFLAEDRILCLELSMKRSAKWHLSYVKASKAETDVPEGISELMGQRRRWLNGSFAAGLYAIAHFYRVYRSSHNIFRLFILHLQFLFNLLNQFLTWFNLGSYYLTITIIIELSANPVEYGSENNDGAFPFPTNVSSIISLIVKYVYSLFVVISFMLALGNKPKSSKWMYYVMMFVFGVIYYYSLVISLYLAAHSLSGGFMEGIKSIGDFGSIFGTTALLIVVALASTFGLYIVTGFLYLDPWHLFTSMAQYFFLMPSFVNILNIFAFCNWHDVSWGTKGGDGSTALPSVRAVKEGNAAVVEEVVLDLEDVDRRFQQVVKRALAPYKEPPADNKLSADDQGRMFRTYLIVTWLVSNVVLIWAITSTDTQEYGMSNSVRQRISYFFRVLLWANAVVAIIRFIGSVLFLLSSALKWFINRK